jgi:hypothetical protein
MTRLLLAFLALLGIVAQAAPAEARPCGQAAQVRLVSASAVVSASHAPHSVAAMPGLAPVAARVFLPGAAPVRLLAFTPAPAVMIKVDRARE